MGSSLIYKSPYSKIRPCEGLYYTGQEDSYVAIMQIDGNFAIYSKSNSKKKLSIEVSKENLPNVLVLNEDKLMIIDSKSTIIWFIKPTKLNPIKKIELGYNGNLYIFDTKDNIIYNTYWLSPTATGGTPIDWYTTGSDIIKPNTCLYPLEGLRSKDGHKKFLMQANGQLVLYIGGMSVWIADFKIDNFLPYTFIFQNDGNL